MCRHALAHCENPSFGGFLERRHVGGGGGGGEPRMFSSIHLPRITGEVRVAYEVTVRMLPWPSRPPRVSSVRVDAPEAAAVNIGDFVVPRQAFVQNV